MSPGSDWLSNFFLFVFLFGLVFTVVSLLLGFSHIGGGMGHDVNGAGHGGFDGGHGGFDGGHGGFDAGHGGGAGHAGVDAGHGGFDAGHGGLDASHGGGVHAGDASHAGNSHAGDTAHAGNGAPSVWNMPTIMAFLTWFGGAGYIFTSVLPIGAIIAVPAAAVSGFTGGAIMFLLLAKLLWPMMSPPMLDADYRMPGTSAHVSSSIREGGTGEIVYKKAGIKFTTGARAADGKPIAQGTQVVVLRYEHGIAYVQGVDAILKSDEGPVEGQLVSR